MARRNLDPEPGIVQIRLIRHLVTHASTFLTPEDTGVTLLRTIPSLAETLGVSPKACRAAIHALAQQGELQVQLHPGGLYELRPLRSADWRQQAQG
jgi:hypothetical protein